MLTDPQPNPSANAEAESAEAWFRLAGFLNRDGRHAEAVDAARKAIELQPNWPQAHNRLGYLLEQHDADLALAAFQRASALAPEWTISRHNETRLLRALGRLQEAEARLREAVRQQPEDQGVQMALAEILLMQERYDEGWPLYEWRFGFGGRTPVYPDTQAPLWDGRRLHGEIVMVWLEQGLGDQLQFCRYLPYIRAAGGRVWLQAPRALRSLLRSMSAIERLCDEGEVPEGFDFQIPLLSLPGVLYRDLPGIPDGVPYLASDASCTAGTLPLLQAPDHTLRVGLVHSSRPDHPSAALRDCPPSMFSRLANIPGVRLYSLQFGSAPTVPDQLSDPPWVELGPILGDFAHTATIVTALDLVITVDTAMAHLCGAIGHPVWNLLSSSCDWRWQHGRSDSPWYPTMRLYRQQRPGDWNAPIEAIATDLAALAVRRHDTPAGRLDL